MMTTSQKYAFSTYPSNNMPHFDFMLSVYSIFFRCQYVNKPIMTHGMPITMMMSNKMMTGKIAVYDASDVDIAGDDVTNVIEDDSDVVSRNANTVDVIELSVVRTEASADVC